MSSNTTSNRRRDPHSHPDWLDTTLHHGVGAALMLKGWGASDELRWFFFAGVMSEAGGEVADFVKLATGMFPYSNKPVSITM